MVSLPTRVRPCVDEAVARSPQLIDRAIAQVALVLQEEMRRTTVSAQRQEFSDAAQQLNSLRADWSARFPLALHEAIAKGVGGTKPKIMASPSSLTFTLVEEDAVMESIEASRLAQQIAGRVEKPLAELDRYMSSALDCEGIQPEANPLRPIVFAQALRTVIGGSGAAQGRPALWMRLMADPLGQDLQALYESCVKLLARAGVEAAGYRVVTGPAPLTGSSPRNSQPAPLEETPSRGAPLRQASGERALMSGWADLAMQFVGGHGLRDFLFGGASAQAQQPLQPAHYRQVDEELAELEAQYDEASPDPGVVHQYRHLPAVDRPVREVGTASPLSHESWGIFGAPRQRSLLRTKLRKKAQRVGQVMGIDVVRQLVDQVARDPRLLAPVREAIVALEPSLARLALHAPRFFGEEDNPARKLLEAVAQRSFKYNDEYAPEFEKFFDAVRQQFNKLNDMEGLVEASPFERAHLQLKNGWWLEDLEEERTRRRMLVAVEQAEKRQGAADQIAWDLSQRSDLEGAPALVQDFLFGPWTLVISQDRIDHPQQGLDPGGYLGVIADLLWSVKPTLTLRDPARAFELIPRVVGKLREGLAYLDHPPAETTAFFEALERLHWPVLKLRAKQRRQALPSDAPAAPLDQDLQPAPAQKPKPREEPWMREAELRDFGFGDTLPVEDERAAPGYRVAEAAGQPAPVATLYKPEGPLDAAQVEAIITQLQQGGWVDLFARQQWRRSQLTWASSKRTLFMFISHGGNAHSMTLRTLQRLVASRHLRPVATHEVVKEALDALMVPSAEAMAA